jgi:hypothetical protein
MFLKLSPRRCGLTEVLWIEMPLRSFPIPSTEVVFVALRYIWTILRGEILEPLVILPLTLVIQFIHLIRGR